MTDRGESRTLDGSDGYQVAPARPSGNTYRRVKFRALGNGINKAMRSEVLSVI